MPKRKGESARRQKRKEDENVFDAIDLNQDGPQRKSVSGNIPIWKWAFSSSVSDPEKSMQNNCNIAENPDSLLMWSFGSEIDYSGSNG
jgi:hypothetical protein